MHRFIHVSLISLLLLASLASADTEVCGTITTTTWTKANSPYCVTDTITIPAGETLTIEPGVDVLFDVSVPLIVDGSIHANGTESDSIRFVRGEAQTWGGLAIQGSDTSTLLGTNLSAFAYTRISDAQGEGGLRIRGFYPDWSDTAAWLTVHLRHCVITGNSAHDGGGVFARYGVTLTMDTCSITGNSATGGEGGGLYYASSGGVSYKPAVGYDEARTTRVTMTGCLVAANTAKWYGGGVCGNFSPGTFTNCMIRDNTGGYVGGLALKYSTSVLTGCTVEGNRSTDTPLGAGVWVGSGTAQLERCIIARNEGAGLVMGHDYPGKFFVTRCTIAGNTASTHGGLYLSVDRPPEDTVAIVTNTILWGNAPDNLYMKTNIYSGQTLFRYNDVGGDSVVAGEGNINTDPMFVDTTTGDYRLQAGSPCIDSGDPNGSPDPDGSRSDMGAHYFPHGLAVRSDHHPIPFALAQNFPNPFNPTTTIRFSLPDAGHVRLVVYALTGQGVRRLIDGTMDAGAHAVLWDGRDESGRPAASGVYLYRLTSGQRNAVGKMMLVR